MLTITQPPRIKLPRGWQGWVKSAVLYAIALANYSIVAARAWAADSINARVRLAAENDRLHQECALLHEELWLKDGRMAQITPQRRPHYGPVERMAILELRAARGWSLKQTANTFLVTPARISAWMKRIDGQGPNALLQLREPVNRFPDFVRYIVQRLKTLSPGMGKVKIAETLCRAGLHLGVTTVGRILKEEPHSEPEETALSTRAVTARYPNHVWHVDLTAVPISAGFWIPWLPFALPQCWPFCWWVAVVVDHHSRRVMGIDIFRNNPTSASISHVLNRAIQTAGAAPNYIICDRGQQFWCSMFKDSCDGNGIKPRFGAVGQHGSIALVERFILSLKNECTRIILVPLRSDGFDVELTFFANWYNHSRPHSSLNGKTPHEVYHDLSPSNERPRFEPRARWPRAARCAFPHAPVAGDCGLALQTSVQTFAGPGQRSLEKRGFLKRDAKNSYLVLEPDDDDALAQLQGHSINYRIAVGLQQGRNFSTLQTLPPDEGSPCGSGRLAKEAGFSLHAGVSAEAHQRYKSSRTALRCRCVSRLAVSEKRMALTLNGISALVCAAKIRHNITMRRLLI